MIDAEWLYWVCGLFFVVGASFSYRQAQYGGAAFWALLGLSFCYSTFVVAKTAPVNGVLDAINGNLVAGRNLLAPEDIEPRRHDEQVGRIGQPAHREE